MLHSFRDPTTGVLKAWGYVSSNTPGDLRQTEPDGFALEPGKWQWSGTTWIPFTPPTPPPSQLAQALDDLFALPAPSPQQIVAVLRVWRQRLT